MGSNPTPPAAGIGSSLHEPRRRRREIEGCPALRQLYGTPAPPYRCTGWEHSFEKGQPVCEEGAFADDFFVILEGSAEVREGRKKRGTLGPGDYFGEIALLRSSLIERSRRTATVTALEPLRCFLLSRSEFQSLLYEEDVAVKILRAVVQRLDASSDL